MPIFTDITIIWSVSRQHEEGGLEQPLVNECAV